MPGHSSVSHSHNFFETGGFRLIGSVLVLILSAVLVGVIDFLVFSIFHAGLNAKIITTVILFLLIGGINVRLITLH